MQDQPTAAADAPVQSLSDAPTPSAPSFPVRCATAVARGSSVVASGTLQGIIVILDPRLWPDGVVSGALIVMVILSAIAKFWQDLQWKMPDVMGTMLSAAWGAVMALDSRSPLKSWLVLITTANLLLMIWFYDTPPTVFATLAVAGFSQYVTARLTQQAPRG